jgi:hypothetical protein
MLIINELSISVFLYTTLLQLYTFYYDLHIMLFLTLAKYQYTHLCYFSLLLKPVAQKIKKR